MLNSNADQYKLINVLGTARLGNISNKDSYKLLDKLRSVNINLLDTAPSYPRSEVRIGSF